MIKRNGFIALIVFFLALSMIANVYTFSKKDTEKKGYINEIIALKKENKELKKENKKEENNSDEKENTEGNTEENKGDYIKDDNTKEVTNNIKKFIEYAFTTNEDNYATRKNLAKNYMNEDLYERLFSADAIHEDKLKLDVSIKDIDVYLHSNSNRKALVRYEVKETIKENNYEEVKEKYLYIETKNNKVNKIETISSQDWGI